MPALAVNLSSSPVDIEVSLEVNPFDVEVVNSPINVLCEQTVVTVDLVAGADIVLSAAQAALAAANAVEGSELAAAQSATEAEASATAAAGSATAAAGSETAAAGSATVASNSAANAAGSATAANTALGYAQEWANKDVDLLVSTGAGGDQIDDYSAKHHAVKANDSAGAAALSEANAAISASEAATSLANIGNAAANAAASAQAAQTAQAGAEAAETEATTQAGIATTAATGAQQAKLDAEFAAQLAEGHEQLAQMYADYASATNLQYVYVTANYTAQSRQGVIADTSGGPFTLTLPATPVQGDQVVVADAEDWSLNPLIVGNNGSTIEDVAEGIVMDIGNIYVFFLYTGDTWRIYAQAIRGSSIIDGGLY